MLRYQLHSLPLQSRNNPLLLMLLLLVELPLAPRLGTSSSPTWSGRRGDLALHGGGGAARLVPVVVLRLRGGGREVASFLGGRKGGCGAGSEREGMRGGERRQERCREEVRLSRQRRRKGAGEGRVREKVREGVRKEGRGGKYWRGGGRSQVERQGEV